jgi:hypothetical protein
MALEQEGFRWRLDDGDEDAATWLADQDTNITRYRNVNTRLRMVINSTGGPTNAQYRLEYRKKGTGAPASVSSPSASLSPSVSPSLSPSGSPSLSPSASPSRSPSLSPSVSPSISPSKSPSASPSISPSGSPSLSPSASLSPSKSPSLSPSASLSPSLSPSKSPSLSPSKSPSVSPSASPSGAAPQAFSDNFDRADADSLGANWTEFGDADISGNKVILVSGSWTACGAIYNTATNTVDQYAMIKFANMLGYASLILRYTDAAHSHYGVQIESSGTITLNSYTSLFTGEQAEDASAAGAWADGNTLGVTMTGTAPVTVRVWVGCTGLPSAVDNWNGDTSPTDTLVASVNQITTGNKVGFGGSGSSANWGDADDFSGGDIP